MGARKGREGGKGDFSGWAFVCGFVRKVFCVQPCVRTATSQSVFAKHTGRNTKAEPESCSLFNVCVFFFFFNLFPFILLYSFPLSSLRPFKQSSSQTPESEILPSDHRSNTAKMSSHLRWGSPNRSLCGFLLKTNLIRQEFGLLGSGTLGNCLSEKQSEEEWRG